MLTVRRAKLSDVSALLALMQELAIYEDYIDVFKVDENEIIARGFGESPEFSALVAVDEESGELLGMAVYYLIPFTFTLLPDMCLKEFFIKPDWRGKGLGDLIFSALHAQAILLGCGQIHWLVMDGNKGAEAFYRKCGASEDTKWQRWYCKIG